MLLSSETRSLRNKIKYALIKRAIINFKQYFYSTVKHTGWQKTTLKKQFLQNNIHKSVGTAACFITLPSQRALEVCTDIVSFSIWNVWKSYPLHLLTITIPKLFNNCAGMKMSLLCTRALRWTSTVCTEWWMSWPCVQATWRYKVIHSARNWHTSKKITRR